MLYKVAIITRTKNRPDFLRRAIGSVSNQSYKDYVHVIVNDGGDKSAVEAIISQQPEDVRKKINLYHRDQSSGAPDTIFNESINRVDSQYVAIHDDDDTWHTDFLRSTVTLLDEGATGVLVRTDKIIEKMSSNGSITTLKKRPYLPHIKSVSIYQQCAENQLTPISFIYKRSAYNEVGGYDNTLPVVGDWEFGLRFLQRYDVEYLDPGFALANYHHRVSSDNSFSLHNHRKYFNMVANRYLREELNDGRMGVGYIISDIRYNQSYIAKVLNRVLPVGIVERLKRRVGN